MNKNYILLCLMITACFTNLFSMETSPEKEDWIFIKNMPGAKDVEDKDLEWHIKNQKLELNLNAKEIMTQGSFADIINDAKKNNLPAILIMAQSGDQGQFIHFFDVTAIKNILANWKKEIDMKPGKSKEKIMMKDPTNRQKIMNMEIYVVGDDGKLRLLKGNVDPNYLENFVKYGGRRENFATYEKYHLYWDKPELAIPGVAQTFIADLYKKQFLIKFSKEQEKKIKTKDLNAKLGLIDELEEQRKKLQKELNLLQKQERAATFSAESENLSVKINEIQAKLNNIIKQSKFAQGALQGTNPQVEKLRQLERLWLSWALNKFLPRDPKDKKAPTEAELQKVKQAAYIQMNEIEDDPDYLEFED